MTQLAVDAALFPDPAMADRAMAINRGLVEQFGSEIVLDAGSCLPCLSLALCYLGNHCTCRKILASAGWCG